MKRNKRIGAIMNILTSNPNKLFSYNDFTEKFNAAKTSISEDVVIVKEILSEMGYGEVRTLSGASGGVKYIPKSTDEEETAVIDRITKILKEEERLLPGNFIYMADLLYNPEIITKVAKMFADRYSEREIDYVVTVETKGIPLAFETARYLNVPLVIIRRNMKISEGTTVTINYVSGSSGKIQTMSLSRRSMDENSKVLLIDDFMKAGGTARGMMDMIKEFKSEVVGIGVLMCTEEPEKKLVDNYDALLTIEKIDSINGELSIKSK